MFGQKENKKQPMAGPPPVQKRQPAEEVVDVREEDFPQEDDDFVVDVPQPENLDQYERQLEDLYQNYHWPINEKEPGFAHVPEEAQRLENEEKQQQIDVAPGFDLFRLRRQRLPIADPKGIEKVFNKWSRHKRNQYIAQLREAFPEINQKADHEKALEVAAELFKNEEDDDFEGKAWLQLQKENAKRIEEEEQEVYSDKFEELKKQKKKIGGDSGQRKEVTDLLVRAIKNNTEEQELRTLKYLMGYSKERPHLKDMERTFLPSKGTAHLEDLDRKLLDQLFNKFTFQGLLVISKLTPKWKRLFNIFFENQTYLWFSNEERNSRRFLPIEDCCEECHQIMDSEPVIRVIDNQLILVIDEVLVLTNGLKCLRLYRFEMKKVLILRKLAEKCPQIQHLDLTECSDFSLMIARELCMHYPKLKHLILTATNLTEEMMAHITKKLTNLVTLAVSSTLITGESLRSLTNKLQRLDIRCCPLLKISALINFLKFSGDIKLQHLKIDDYKDKEVYQLIWKIFRSSLILLEVMDTKKDGLGGKSYIGDMPLMRNLKSINLGKNVVFEARVFDTIIISCPYLRSFSMRFEAHDEFRLSEQNLLQITHNWLLLERLELIGCTFLGEEFIESLQRLTKLEYLNLTESRKLNDGFMCKLLPKLLTVHYLVLDKCINLGKRTVESGIVKAKAMSPQLFRISMIKCNLQGIPYLKAKYLPQNLRITYSSLFGRRYVSFDGQQIKIGNISDISQFLNEK